jgi:hypothetical protein
VYRQGEPRHGTRFLSCALPARRRETTPMRLAIPVSSCVCVLACKSLEPLNGFSWVYHLCLNRQNVRLWICYMCLLFSARTCFGYSFDHLQGVPHYKYQEYNRNHVKCIIDISKNLSENSIVYFMWYLLYSWYLYCRTSWRWSQAWKEHVGGKNRRHI